MTKTLKNENIDSIINWITFNVVHVESMLIICKKEDSYIPGALKEARKFIKELKQILNVWQMTKDNPAKFIQEITKIIDSKLL